MCVTVSVCMKQHLIFHTMSCQLRVIRNYCFYRKWKIESNNKINASLAGMSTFTTGKCTEYCTGLLQSAFSTSLKQSSYVVLPKVNVETQSFFTFSIFGPKRSPFNKLDVMNHREFSYLLLFPSMSSLQLGFHEYHEDIVPVFR